MRVSSVLIPVIALVLVISLICIWFFPSVQDFMASNAMWNGIRGFQNDFNAKNINTLDDLPASPENTALVEISYLQYNEADLSALKKFVEDGGTLVVMDDYGSGNEVLAYLGLDVRFSNKTLLDPLFNYKNQTMPRITDFIGEVKNSGVTLMTFNYATILTNVKPSDEIAWSSSASFLYSGSGTNGPDNAENTASTGTEPKGPFPVAAKVRLGKGIVDIISDPSIIISGMIDRGNNFHFIQYLVRTNDGQKDVLFDTTHLPKSPLDTSKDKLLAVRDAISSPYALVGITAIIFGTVSFYTLRKGLNEQN